VTRGSLFALLALALLAAPLAVEAQPGGKVYPIGYLVLSPSPLDDALQPTARAPAMPPRAARVFTSC
jgi:hypothetical protein